MSIKIIHTADWQIGKNFDYISDNTKRENLRRARIDSLAKIGEIAREQKADFIVVAGDLFDSPTSDKNTLITGLAAIGKLGLPVFAIPGNHDHGGAGGFWELDFFKRQQRELAPNFTILLQSEPFELERAWILPCPLLRRAESEDPTAWIRQRQMEDIARSEKPVILLAHGSTQSFAFTSYDDEEGDSGTPNRIDLKRLPAGLVDYAALGDWHGSKQIEDWAWYSGTHEPDRFSKGGDHNPGNILSVEIARRERPRIEKIRTASLAWHNMEYVFGGDETLTGFRNMLNELLGRRVGEDLLQLDLSGSLGLKANADFQSILESLEVRLLRLKLRSRVRMEATSEEIEELITRSKDPLIALVAKKLIEKTSREEGTEIAALALQELYAAVHTDCSEEVDKK